MDRQPLTLRMFDAAAPIRGAERNEHSEHAPVRNVTEHEPNIPNTTVPLAAFLKLKGQLREYRARCAVAEARVQALQATLAEVLQGMNHGEG
jgi:hypothetical protein